MHLSEVRVGMAVIVDDPDVSPDPIVGIVVDIDPVESSRDFVFIDVEYLECTGAHKGAIWPMTDYFLSCNMERLEWTI